MLRLSKANSHGCSTPVQQTYQLVDAQLLKNVSPGPSVFEDLKKFLKFQVRFELHRKAACNDNIFGSGLPDQSYGFSSVATPWLALNPKEYSAGQVQPKDSRFAKMLHHVALNRNHNLASDMEPCFGL
eukprot:GHVP01014058.1.p2 GENE.GHVP01014058.1~~GHVP01014058.1.p2  ORF type:complete len:128 (+),score=21.29 GHVP01014058.1:242-625(+)